MRSGCRCGIFFRVERAYVAGGDAGHAVNGACEVELIRNSFNAVVNPEAHTKHKSFILSLAESFSSPARLQAEIMQALKNSGESTRTFIRKLTNL